MSEQSSRGAAWETLRLQCLDRDGWTCTYCHKKLEGDDATADHIVSKERWRREDRPGTPDTLDNLVAACRSCNSSKGGRDSLPRINYYNPRWFPSQGAPQ